MWQQHCKERQNDCARTMEIESTLTNKLHQTLRVVYREADPLKDVEGRVLRGVHAYCFYGDQLVIVYAKNKAYWTPPGGGIEPGEKYTEAIVREVTEETNMRVLYQERIGYIDIYEPDRIVRHVRSCCLVEPIGDFVADPGGDITEIKMIDPADMKNYVDWGVIGDQAIRRALEIKEKCM